MICLGVISDTHGDRSCIRYAVKLAGNVDGWIHLGDYVRDAEVLHELTGLMVYRIRGNCDFDMTISAEETLEFENARVFIAHGHQYSVKWTMREIAARAEELNCDAALFGHTHVSSLEASGRCLLLNPGSASVPRNCQKPSFALLMLNGNDVNAKIITM